MMEWFRRAPNSIKITVIIVCGVLALGILAVYTLMTLNGADTTEFRQWINTLGQIIVFPLLGISATASISAANSARKAEVQTNSNLHNKETEIAELKAQLNERDDHGSGTAA